MHHRAPALRAGALAPLLAAVTMAEEISRDVAARQALLAEPPLARALRAQSWQEAGHAALFRRALRCLPGKGACPQAVERALRRYADQLHADLDRRDLCASLVGLQCVLEGLAGVALEPPAGELARWADRLVPLRSVVLHQEQGHRRLGEIWVPRLASPTGVPRGAADTYLGLAAEVLDAGLRHLDCLAADAEHYSVAATARFGETRRRLAAA